MSTPDRPPVRPPPGMPDSARAWWQRPWAVVGLVVAGIAVGAAAGGGAGSSKTVTQVAAASTVTTTETQTVTHHIGVRTVTATQTQTATTSPPAASSGSAGGGSGKTYSGDGSVSVGTVNVPVDSYIEWDCSSCNGQNQFFLSSDPNPDGNDISINSGSPTGKSAVSAGKYTNVQTIQQGSWSFKVVPQ